MKRSSGIEIEELEASLQNPKRPKFSSMNLASCLETINKQTELKEAVDKFKKNSSEEIQKLVKEQGLDFQSAVAHLYDKIKTEKPTEPQSQDIQMVMQITGYDSITAKRTLMVKEELVKLRHKGLDATQSIDELIFRMKSLSGIKRTFDSMKQEDSEKKDKGESDERDSPTPKRLKTGISSTNSLPQQQQQQNSSNLLSNIQSNNGPTNSESSLLPPNTLYNNNNNSNSNNSSSFSSSSSSFSSPSFHNFSSPSFSGIPLSGGSSRKTKLQQHNSSQNSNNSKEFFEKDEESFSGENFSPNSPPYSSPDSPTYYPLSPSMENSSSSSSSSQRHEDLKKMKRNLSNP